MDPISDIHAQIGESKIRAMIAAFYRRVRADDLIGPMYPADDWQGAEKRLADFLIYRFGGSQQYLAERGHPRLRARHFPFAIGAAERDRWLHLMGQAIAEVEIPKTVQPTLTSFFSEVATAMQNHS